MDLELFEEGFGKINLSTHVPAHLQSLLLQPATPHVITGHQFTALLEQFSGDGFQAWYNRVWAQRPFRLLTRGDLSALELRVAWRHRIEGRWDTIDEPSLPPQYFQLAFTPHIQTQAIFRAAAEYQTFDIHFSLSYLQNFGLDYPLMDRFITQVLLRHPAALAPHPYPCSAEMIHLIQLLLHSQHSAAGKRRQLQHLIGAILTAALEVVRMTDDVSLPLTMQDRSALYAIREFLDQAPLDEYPGNDVLLRHVHPHLNTWKLNYGFRQVFAINPEEYFLRRRFSEAQAMLAQGRRVIDVAHFLGYSTSSTFIKEFRKRFGTTPKQWRMGR